MELLVEKKISFSCVQSFCCYIAGLYESNTAAFSKVQLESEPEIVFQSWEGSWPGGGC